MTFHESFKEVVDTCAHIRYDISSVLSKRLSKIQEAFTVLYGKDKSWYKSLNNAYHYRHGGYPSESSSPKYETVAEKLGQMFCTLEYVGMEDMINNYLRRHFGVVLQRVEDTQKIVRLSNPDMEAFEKTGLSIDLDLDDVELYKNLLERMDSTQSEICEKSDSIKIDSFEGLADSFPNAGLSKSTFVRAVNTKALEYKDTEKAESKKEKLQAQNELENELLDVVID